MNTKKKNRSQNLKRMRAQTLKLNPKCKRRKKKSLNPDKSTS